VSAQISTRTLQAAKFHRCVDAVAKAFHRNKGELSRQQFKNLCRKGNYHDSRLLQAYFEGAGMKVQRAGKDRMNSDVFAWRLP
jgi:hypothetical protein